MAIRSLIGCVWVVLIACNVQAAVPDKHMTESQKCGRIFPYFERRYKIPLDTLHSISLKESGRLHPEHKIVVVWPWAVNVEGEGYYFDSKREAVLFTKKQLLMGKQSIDVGCMQINLKHHPKAFTSIEQAFDPGRNISYGAQFLRSKYEQLGDWHKAIAHYHSATSELGTKYKKDVIKIASQMGEYKNTLKQHSSKPNIEKKRVFIDQYYAVRAQKIKERQRLYAEQRRGWTASQNSRYRSPMSVRVPKS